MKTKERGYAGFVLNKLWVDRYWCGEGKNQHLGHTSLDNIPKGKPRSEKSSILKVVTYLIRLGFICSVSANQDRHVCASRAAEKITEALPIVNEYRTSVGLTPLSEKGI
ncbi:MAG: hypothetical protein NWF05_01450 [Candidatus Bathyarchaeota archaeon]|nr:hypothetical protein [Candidatus Bathyarchaeota archaeon]